MGFLNDTYYVSFGLGGTGIEAGKGEIVKTENRSILSLNELTDGARALRGRAYPGAAVTE